MHRKAVDKMKRKIAMLCLALALVTILVVGGTLAYLQARTDTATNTFKFGDVTGELTENGIPGPGYVDWDKSDTDPNNNSAINIVPNQTVQKAPVVTNTGSTRAFVRLTVSGPVGPEGTTEIFEFVGLNVGDEDTKDWVLYNGKYYYKTVLEPPVPGETPIPGESTTALFTGVKLRTDASLQLSDVEIKVYAELLQADYVDITGLTLTSEEEALAVIAPAIPAFMVVDGL
jgi:predicted ribosomally synthesized peptide with SipW-like signal peptide